MVSTSTIDMTPLYNHTNELSSYRANIPYGPGGYQNANACYWLEKKAGRGFRFCYIIEHPKTKRWSKPERSAYCNLAGCMYLNEDRRVLWSGLTKDDNPEDVRDFIIKYHKADFTLLYEYANEKLAQLDAGELMYTSSDLRAQGAWTTIKFLIGETDKEDFKAWCKDKLNVY